MTRAPRAALWLVPALAGAAGHAGGAATSGSTESALAHCSGIGAAEARLACYDALAQRLAHDSAPLATAPTVATAPAPASTPANRTSRAPAPAAGSAAVVVPEPAAAAPAVAAPDPETATKNFGFSAAQLHTVDQGPQAIKAHVAKVIIDANRRGYVMLDNGQTWALTDGELLLDAGEAVTVSRAALGSYMLTSASNRAYHVRRIR